MSSCELKRLSVTRYTLYILTYIYANLLLLSCVGIGMSTVHYLSIMYGLVYFGLA